MNVPSVVYLVPSRGGGTMQILGPFVVLVAKVVLRQVGGFGRVVHVMAEEFAVHGMEC